MPPTKRQRGGTHSDLDEPARGDIWFADGNVVLQAESTQFRVYKGTLCSYSEVFKRLLDGIEDYKGVDGCPLVHVSDSSIDMEHILRTIFCRWSYPDSDPLPFGVISAFARLGKKYRIQPLYDNALLRLQYAFPSSYEEYVKSNVATKILFANPTNSRVPQCEIAIDTIVLARELDVPSLLPISFWLAATRIELLSAHDSPSLSDADRKILMSSSKPLRIAHASYLYGWLDENHINPDCTRPPTCAINKTRLALKLWKPPGVTPAFGWQLGLAKPLCESCIAAGLNHHSAGSQQLWRELPSFFGLRSWEELLVAPPNAQG
ncbi:hypothetical protein B0H17DRAFT_1337283 [Mycena rosella]|uniref:BTB domain-containing protein n=1 Tax=Mycena rosella TaxID=1033263 RepID=A0AAD7CSJ4_MYCRO|nr:hypothetical protein B0H17DRAFT_1337283 [Mycena rosella]